MSEYFCYTVLEHNMFLVNLLGVDGSVGIIERPDHVMGKPRAGYNGTQPWKRRKSTSKINQSISTSSKPERAEVLLSPLQAPGGLLLTPAQLAFSVSALFRASQASNVRLSARSLGLFLCNDLWTAWVRRVGREPFGRGIKPPPTFCMMVAHLSKNVMMMGVCVGFDGILCNQVCIDYHMSHRQ